ncbi:MAG: type III-B CRISPR module RAMP protein Cmr4 [Microcystis sp. M54BS1]|uniref:type III-B CRISPR module RAMP protein Cmr4 n=1 Tax=unclassified Microcystis TaxID=2643300 RepID=UPI002579C781|nr:MULTISPECIES: type III-B CRISPR module RAMP protein Cmr4 [unclassified Microcystis]MCA2539448.1 type III-B CRISPR module RAMP protein Cmr4 [Microcystis sp. M54BS1]MCA2593605.1 type III-B CRISPR module RAMP protein Cmr4 [Microcystis sp. M38BS1]MCA2609598.1 type III-B CRISPR module RAMP protein Cmr4 [Microcystis sp. M27BS1]MCA2505633.1 type III-B CRISPR module RAMP protein Cmr4 [Microcystis sp. M62BS1]MCA2513463.1 type III-B CRISPR module RAMP protein Cmr4 [Microcystis sp. M60BS1]
MNTYLTYLYLLTPLHTGGSADEGNLMGIAREVHTEFPYLPASSLRGKIRSALEPSNPQSEEEKALAKEVSQFFGQKIKDGQQPTEGEVWFAEATLLFFPIASLSHHLVWITCPLWLERWNRWLKNSPLTQLIQNCREQITEAIPALVSFTPEPLYLQTAILQQNALGQLNTNDSNSLSQSLQNLTNANGMINQLLKKLVIVDDEDCIALVETGLQREVRVALNEGEKTVKGGSFRSEEAIPPETVLFFPWGMKPVKQTENTQNIRGKTSELLKNKLQFGGLEGLGRGWCDLKTIETTETITGSQK